MKKYLSFEDWFENEGDKLYNPLRGRSRSNRSYNDNIKKAELYASILATEDFLACNIGFTKYLN